MTASGLPSSSSSAPQLPGAANPSPARRRTLRSRAINIAIAVLTFGLIFVVQLVTARVAGAYGPRYGWLAQCVGMSVLSLAFFAAMVLLVRRTDRERRERVARSVPVTGEVVRVEVEGVRGDSGYSERPVVRYETADGQGREHRTAAPHGRLKAGDRVDLRYDPQEPEWVVVGDGLDGARRWRIGFAVAYLVLLFALPTGLGAYRFATWDPGAASRTTSGTAPTDTATPPAATPPAAQTTPAAPRPADPPNGPDWTLLLCGIGCAAFFGTQGLRRGRKVQRWRAQRARALEVNATVTKLDRAKDRARAIPTLQYRTFDGQELTARSAVALDGKRELALAEVGTTLRVAYDPQQPDWVTPAMATTRSLTISAMTEPVVGTAFGVLAIVIAFVPS